MNMHTSMHARTHYTIARLHIHYTGASGAKPVVGVTVASSELSDLQIKCKTYQEELAEVCAVHRHNLKRYFCYKQRIVTVAEVYDAVY